MALLFLRFLMILFNATLLKESSGLQTRSSSTARGIKNHQGIYPEGPKDTERTVVILFNKPENVVTSHVSGDTRATVYDEVQSMKGYAPGAKLTASSNMSFQQATGIASKLHSIGRLDADTTGLLLLTNDGGLVHHVTNPNASSHANGAITKTYEALIMGHHDEESLSPLRIGVDIGAKYGGMTLPVNEMEVLDHPNHRSTMVSLTISEGKNRQVRRMFHALGSGVMKLKRTKIGENLTLNGLEIGQWRTLSDDEVHRNLQWKPRQLQSLPSIANSKKRRAGTRDRGRGRFRENNVGRRRRRRS